MKPADWTSTMFSVCKILHSQNVLEIPSFLILNQNKKCETIHVKYLFFCFQSTGLKVIKCNATDLIFTI